MSPASCPGMYAPCPSQMARLHHARPGHACPARTAHTHHTPPALAVAPEPVALPLPPPPPPPHARERCRRIGTPNMLRPSVGGVPGSAGALRPAKAIAPARLPAPRCSRLSRSQSWVLSPLVRGARIFNACRDLQRFAGSPGIGGSPGIDGPPGIGGPPPGPTPPLAKVSSTCLPWPAHFLIWK